MTDQVLVTSEGVVHLPRTTSNGIPFWPIVPKCGSTSPQAKLFWQAYLNWDTTSECQDCNAS